MPLPTDLDREQRLDEVIASYLRALKEGSAPNREQLLDTHPDLAEDLAEFFADQDSFKRLAAPLRQAVPISCRVALPRQFGNYELFEEVARGGMGVIYKARQFLGEAHGDNGHRPFRLVALKLLLAGPLASEADLRRFRLEAETIASLNHPNIVPIHEVGAQDGQWFLSMKLIEGGTLASQRGKYCGNPKETARLVAAVADAVHHAHQHGILHRDLKPSNILLEHPPLGDTTHRETGQDTIQEWVPYVSDFGLARRNAASESTAGVRGQGSGGREDKDNSFSLTGPPVGAHTGVGASPSHHRPLTPAPALTRTGDIVGTPSYMAPEQASGKLGAVTVVADVYGLGAILYELLTGRPPFAGINPLDTVLQLLNTDPVRPQAVCKNVNRDLETICLKCLSREPERRYASAAAVAEDLRRFLRGEPIVARPVGWLERFLRWTRRQPVVAFLSFALVLAVLAGVGLVGWQWYRAEVSLTFAETQRSLAEAQTQRAEGLLLEAEEARNRAELNFKQAEVHRLQAENNQQQADANFRTAHAAVSDLCLSVGEELENYPGLQQLRKRLLQNGLAYYKKFLKERGRTQELLLEQSETHVRVGRLFGSVGNKPDARLAYQEAMAILRELHQRDPDNRFIRHRLASVANNLGASQDFNDQALPYYLESLELANKFLSTEPTEINLLAGKAVTLSNLGSIYKNKGQLGLAREYHVQALQLQEKLLEQHAMEARPVGAHAGVVRPGSVVIREDMVKADLAATLKNLGALCNQEQPGSADALSYYRRCCDLLAGLAKAQPRNYRRQADLAGGLHSLALALRDANKKSEANDVLEQEVEIRDRLVRDNPSVNRYQVDLGVAYTALGNLLAQKGKALGYYQQARDVYLKLVKSDPKNPNYQADLAQAHLSIGMAHGAMEHRPEERHAFQQARELQEQLVKTNPDNLDCHYQLARILNNLGLNLGITGHCEEAALVLRQGIEHQRLVLDRTPQSTNYRQLLSKLYGNLSEAERGNKALELAAKASLDKQKLWPGNPAELFRCSCELGRTAQLAGKGSADKPLTPRQQAERSKIAEQALACLREAVKSGFKDVERLQKEPDLEVLRSLPEFKEVLQDAAKPGTM